MFKQAKIKNSNTLIIALLAVVFTVCGGGNVSAHNTALHTWTDAQGHKNISTIPPQGFTTDGRLRRQYDPNSIQFQHHEMRKALRQQAAEIAAANERVGESHTVTPADALPAVRAPREGIMGLRELIKLERRSGRYAGDN